MARKNSSILSHNKRRFPPAAMSSTLIIYLLLSIGLVYLMFLLQFPAIGLIGALIINMVVLFFIRSRLAFPLYVVAAGPSVALSLASSGVLSRLYIGNLLFALVVGIWIFRYLLAERKSGRTMVERSLLVPLLVLIATGSISILYSRLFPDPTVAYSFPHSNVSLTVVNLSELVLLIGLPMFLVVVPGLVRSLRDARWVLGAYIAIGSLYVLGTIFAAPLGLYSKEVILGIRRPQVFGSVSSGLGTLIVLFTSLAFGQVLYARSGMTRLLWGLTSFVFAVGVIMTLGRESWIGLFLAVLIMVALRTKSWAVLLFLLVPLFLLFIPGVSDFFNPSKVYGSDRFKIWLDAISIWQHSPIMGVGAGNYQFFDVIYGKDVVGVAHNQYLQVLAEMGVQGLLCLIWVIIASGRIAIKRFNTAKTALGKALSLAYVGFFASLVFGGLFSSAFVPSAADGGGTSAFVESSYRWLLLGLVLSIPNWEKEAVASEQATRPENLPEWQEQAEQEVQPETVPVPGT